MGSRTRGGRLTWPRTRGCVADDDLAVGIDDGRGDLGRVARAAVGERGVGVGELDGA